MLPVSVLHSCEHARGAVIHLPCTTSPPVFLFRVVQYSELSRSIRVDTNKTLSHPHTLLLRIRGLLVLYWAVKNPGSSAIPVPGHPVICTAPSATITSSNTKHLRSRESHVSAQPQAAFPNHFHPFLIPFSCFAQPLASLHATLCPQDSWPSSSVHMTLPL